MTRVSALDGWIFVNVHKIAMLDWKRLTPTTHSLCVHLI
jgi:hypothetical protein